MAGRRAAPGNLAPRLVRTWAFRGTLHYLTATDLTWLLPLLAPVIIRRNARRYRQLALDEPTFAQSNQEIRAALEAGRPLIRAEIARALEKAGISAEGQRIYYLVQRAALEGILCHGPQRGRDPTYVLIAQWVGAQTVSEPDNAWAALAERYFSSHGPATVQDFAWWSGLPVSVARQALDAATDLVRVEEENEMLWAKGTPPEPLREHAAYLLPPYDSYLLSYKDRSWALDLAYAKRVNAGGGMPKPTIVVNGQVVGIWKRAITAHRIVITLELFRALNQDERAALETAAHRYGDFYALPIEIQS